LPTCEDPLVTESYAICGVCDRPRIHGDRTDRGDVFICTDCQAVARQFIAIQNPVWGEATQVPEASGNGDKEQSQRDSSS
jgi:hypothetical protein